MLAAPSFGGKIYKCAKCIVEERCIWQHLPYFPEQFPSLNSFHTLVRKLLKFSLNLMWKLYEIFKVLKIPKRRVSAETIFGNTVFAFCPQKSIAPAISSFLDFLVNPPVPYTVVLQATFWGRLGSSGSKEKKVDLSYSEQLFRLVFSTF